MTSYDGPFLCAYCKHLDWDVEVVDGVILQTCRAFTEGIPTRFFNPDVFHLTTTGDDNGIVFEAEDEATIPDDLKKRAGL